MSDSSNDFLMRRLEFLEGRSDRLERSLRRWRLGGAAAIALLGAVVAIGPDWASAQERKGPGGVGGPPSGPPRAAFVPEYKAMKFTLVDNKGKELAFLGSDEGAPMLKLLAGEDGDEGVIIAGAVAGKKGGVIMINGLDAMITSGEGGGTFQLIGDAFTPACKMSIDNEKGTAEVKFYGGAPGPGIVISTDEKTANLKIMDADGKEVFSKP